MLLYNEYYRWFGLVCKASGGGGNDMMVVLVLSRLTHNGEKEGCVFCRKNWRRKSGGHLFSNQSFSAKCWLSISQEKCYIVQRRSRRVAESRKVTIIMKMDYEKQQHWYNQRRNAVLLCCQCFMIVRVRMFCFVCHCITASWLERCWTDLTWLTCKELYGMKQS